MLTNGSTPGQVGLSAPGGSSYMKYDTGPLVSSAQLGTDILTLIHSKNEMTDRCILMCAAILSFLPSEKKRMFLIKKKYLYNSHS